MTQGDHLVMTAYVIRILLLINNLKQEIPDVTQPWYAEYAGALGILARLDTYFDLLICHGPGRGYHPDLTKSILIVQP